jgi:hypothetical protein
VPAQECLRRDEQAVAARTRKQAARRREENTVSRSQRRALDLAAENLELMAQHDQLDVLDLHGAVAPNQQLQEGDEAR